MGKIIGQQQTPVGLWYSNGSPNLGPKTRSYNNQQKKKKKRKSAKLSTLLSRPQNKTERMWKER